MVLFCSFCLSDKTGVFFLALLVELEELVLALAWVSLVDVTCLRHAHHPMTSANTRTTAVIMVMVFLLWDMSSAFC